MISNVKYDNNTRCDSNSNASTIINIKYLIFNKLNKMKYVRYISISKLV